MNDEFFETRIEHNFGFIFLLKCIHLQIILKELQVRSSATLDQIKLYEIFKRIVSLLNHTPIKKAAFYATSFKSIHSILNERPLIFAVELSGHFATN